VSQKSIKGIREVMTKDVVTVLDDLALSVAADKLTNENVSSLVVVDGVRPIGIVILSDLARLMESSHENMTVKQVMSSPVKVIYDSDDVEVAIEVLEKNEIRHLPVIDASGRLKGILTVNDLLSNYFAPMLSLKAALESIQEHGYSGKEQANYERLLEGETRFRALYEAIDMPVFVYPFSNEGFERFVEVNDAACQALGYSRAELLSLSAFDIADDVSAEREARQDQRMNLLKRGDSVAFSDLIRKDGSRFPAEIRPHVFYFKDRPYVMSLARDLTQQEQEEKALKQASVVFEHAIEGVMITDEHAHIVSVNPAFSSITGFSKEEVLGKNPSVLKSGNHDRAFYKRFWNNLQKNGQWQGEMWNKKKSGEVYPVWQVVTTVKNSDQTVQFYIGSFSDISELRKVEQDLHYLSHHNPITGLPNRERAKLELEKSIQHHVSGTFVSVLQLDLDRFKNINEGYGFEFGDALLKEVAIRIQDCLPRSAVTANPSGDKFTVILTNLNSQTTLILLVQRLLEKLSSSYSINDVQLYCPTSIGIALADEQMSTSAIMQHAESALHQAKNRGGNTYQFYCEELDEISRKHIDLDAGLRQALDSDQFVLMYQPQVNTASNELDGVEALIRWEHPEKGMISPLDFIPRTEKTGLIIPIGEMILEKACMQMKAWLDVGVEVSSMSVNISPRQFSDYNLINHVKTTLEKTGLAAHYLELEITESGLMDSGSESVLGELKALGVRVAIDDFGTGHSSLSRLNNLAIDKLKIDRSFIMDIPTNENSIALTKGIISLARNLNIDVIAEGVETQDQLEFVMQQGCHKTQGYFFSAPLRADALEEWAKALGK